MLFAVRMFCNPEVKFESFFYKCLLIHFRFDCQWLPVSLRSGYDKDGKEIEFHQVFQNKKNILQVDPQTNGCAIATT